MRVPLSRRNTALCAAAAILLPAGAVAQAAGPGLSPLAAVPQVAAAATTGPVPSTIVTSDGLAMENAFVSSVGWVKPGESYPSRLVLSNSGQRAITDITVSVSVPRGAQLTQARPVAKVGTATLSQGAVQWRIPALAAGARALLVLEARALTQQQDPTIAWRDLSSTAVVNHSGAARKLEARAHGPKVIPATGGYESARYGDRPFPVVPVDYADFQHTPANSSAKLDKVINDRTNPASTFNLYQEMSLGQLFPAGAVPSAGVTTKPVIPGLKFSVPSPTQTTTCTGTTMVDPISGAPLPTYTRRVKDGWYQLPGMRGYYGSDGNGSAVVGSVAGVGALQQIDSGCGPTAKLAYDAAVVADADIDYSDYDTDKDGVVDFFEVVFQGLGGNGGSQLGGVPPYDNVWPHSSTLESSYADPATGLSGYISRDQLRDLEDRPLWYTDTGRAKMTTTDKGAALKVFVRVGPYNVNPESAIDKASVISHEYGHSLGLPDYYSTGSRSTYGDFTLMATDKSQNMDIIGRKELGWVVPEVLAKGTTKVGDWQDSKIDTRVIHWVTPAGRPYSLSQAGGDQGIHNAQAYVATLKGRTLIDPKLVTAGASGTHVWYSGQGNGFGCAPTGGHNLDIALPGIENVPAGTKITATLKSYWDIEWDFDYGFVMAGKPDSHGTYGYAALPSGKGYTTPSTQNPNSSGCQSLYGNGLTGSSGSYGKGQPAVDRVTGTYSEANAAFLPDSYDLSSLAGVKGGVMRFSYSTDPGLARKGWLIDDLVIKAGDKVLFSSDFEKNGDLHDPHIYNGGCKEGLTVSGGVCTKGWGYVAAGQASPLERAYLMEMRDRSGFDFDGRGQNDREAIAFKPGVLLTYTDEAHGYGNAGTDDPPAQSPLDAVPTPGSAAPDLSDAAFVAGQSFTDAASSPHVDNYVEPARGKALEAGKATQNWTFDNDCLSFKVLSMSGDTDNAADKRDLRGAVSFTLGAKCALFNYGFGNVTDS